MDINPIAANNTPQVAVTTEASTAKTLSAVQSQSANNKKDTVTLNAPLSDKSIQIGQVNDLNNNTALMAKETSLKLVDVAAVVDRMRETLGGIIKNYPPFPPESRERMELLMSYASIHKELLQMTVPPPPAPIYEQVKHQWQDLFPNASLQPTKLPSVPDSGTPDSVLGSMVSELNGIHDSLGAMRASIKQALTGS